MFQFWSDKRKNQKPSICHGGLIAETKTKFYGAHDGGAKMYQIIKIKIPIESCR